MAQPKGKQFRGLATPRNIDKQTAFMLEQISRHLRTVPGSEPNLTGFLGPQDNSIFAPSDGQVRKAGGLSDLPPVPHGTTTTWTFPIGTYVPSTAMLQLAGGYYQKTANDTLTLRSDGSRYYEIGRAGNPTFIPASNWGAIPDTGVDMAVQIQAALTNCPTGATLYFEPGTYVVSSNLKCIVPINIYAYGAVWDWGTSWDSKTTVSFPTLPTTLDSSDTGDAAFTFGYAPSSGTTTSINLSVAGLKLTRTAASAAPSSYKGAGFRFLSTYQCHFQDLDVSGFNVGYWCSGSVSGTYERGFAYNRLHNLNASSVAFGIYLDPGMANGSNSGWCNENSFFGGRMALSPTLQANADGCCAVYIRFAATDTHECNNNVFEHLSLEGQSGAGAYWGHKIYCQGRYNAFVWCRYEDPSGRAVPHVVADITFIDAGGGGGTNNVLFYGFDLYKQNIVGDGSNMFNHIYSQTGMDLDRNHTITGRHLLLGNTASGLYSQSIILGNGDTPGLTLVNTTGAAKNALMVKAANETDNRLALRESTDNSQYVGGMVGYTGSGAGTERNWIGLRNASPYHWGIYKGLVLNVSADATIAALRLTPVAGDPTTPGDGDLWYNSATGKFRKREGGASSNLDTTGLSDADYGDVTVSGTGTVITIDNDVVTYAKMQNVSATDKLLGRSTAGAGDVEEIPCTAAGRALLDDATASDQRTTLGLGSANVTTCYKSTDQSAIGTSFADVTGLSLTMASSTSYAFEFHMLMESDATTTGIDVSVNGPASPDDVQFEIVYWTTANARTERHGNAYDFDTASTVSNGTAARWYLVRGVVRNGTTAGDLVARAKREAVGSGPTCKAGSYGILYKLT